tara:strand:- start:63 stop:725 length:663 start_codon:yes stop_codon:yes gene_type:complete
MKDVAIIKNSKDLDAKLKKLVDSNKPVIIVKNYITNKVCDSVIKFCHIKSKNSINQKKNKHFFYSIDVHPKGSKTDRIFRTFIFNKFTIFQFLKKLIDLQKITVLKKVNEKNILRRVQVIHYPVGGGFFATHKHPRYPTNYGLILNLSKRKRDFIKGSTNFYYKKKIIDLEKMKVNQGDLILFRFDLKHFISPIDPKEDLSFSIKGRWTLVMPIFKKTKK